MEKDIKNLLTESPEITTTEIARRLRRSRTTVIRYLKILKSKGIVDFRKAGPSKLWYVIEKEAEKARIKEEGAELSNALRIFLNEAFPFEMLKDEEKKVLLDAQEILKKKFGETWDEPST